MQENEIISDEGKMVTIMNKYLGNITKHSHLKANIVKCWEKLMNMLDQFKKSQECTED